MTTRHRIIELWHQVEQLIDTDESILDPADIQAMEAVNTYLESVAELTDYLQEPT